MPTANLSRLLDWNRARRPDKEALVHGARRFTYAQLDDEVHACAAGMLDIGLGRGDIVAILAENSWRYVVEMLAAARIGAAFLPLNWRLHERELTYIVGHSGARCLITDTRFIEQARTVSDNLDIVERVVVTNPESGELPEGWSTYDALVTTGRGRIVHDAEMDLDDLQRILYTSGTTSHPKGVMITHGNVIWNQLGQILELEMNVNDRILASAPFFHVSGLDVPGFTTLYMGATLVLNESTSGRHIAELIQEESITGMVLAAQIVYDMRSMEDLETFDLSSVRWMVACGIPPATFQQIQDDWAHIRMVDCYGMTELTNGGAYMDREHRYSKIGSQGRAFVHLDLRIVDDDRNPLPAGEVGEIAIRGPKVTKGYWRDPEATAASYEDGWFYSGDLARIDEDGYLWFVDRKKDMIKSGGENVASIEIEAVLARHPDVREVAVVGVPDARWDEVPKAFVTVSPQATITGDDLRAFCGEHLGKFKVPREVEIVSDLPRNDSGKVLKRVLRDVERARFEAGE